MAHAVHPPPPRDRDGDASLSEALKAAIRDRGLTAYALAKMAGVQPHVVQRFLNDERGMYLATADKLAAVLGLGLAVRGPQPGGRSRRRPPPRRRDEP